MKRKVFFVHNDREIQIKPDSDISLFLAYAKERMGLPKIVIRNKKSKMVV